MGKSRSHESGLAWNSRGLEAQRQPKVQQPLNQTRLRAGQCASDHHGPPPSPLPVWWWLDWLAAAPRAPVGPPSRPVQSSPPPRCRAAVAAGSQRSSGTPSRYRIITGPSIAHTGRPGHKHGNLFDDPPTGDTRKNPGLDTPTVHYYTLLQNSDSRRVLVLVIPAEMRLQVQWFNKSSHWWLLGPRCACNVRATNLKARQLRYVPRYTGLPSPSWRRSGQSAPVIRWHDKKVATKRHGAPPYQVRGRHGPHPNIL